MTPLTIHLAFFGGSRYVDKYIQLASSCVVVTALECLRVFKHSIRLIRPSIIRPSIIEFLRIPGCPRGGGVPGEPSGFRPGRLGNLRDPPYLEDHPT